MCQVRRSARAREPGWPQWRSGHYALLGLVAARLGLGRARAGSAPPGAGDRVVGHVGQPDSAVGAPRRQGVGLGVVGAAGGAGGAAGLLVVGAVSVPVAAHTVCKQRDTWLGSYLVFWILTVSVTCHSSGQLCDFIRKLL